MRTPTLLLVVLLAACSPDSLPTPPTAEAKPPWAGLGKGKWEGGDTLPPPDTSTPPPDTTTAPDPDPVPDPLAHFEAVIAGLRARGYGAGTYTLIWAQAGATNYFVAQGGSDSNPGTSQAPFRTINHAAQIARAGDVVIIRDGTYAETVEVASPGVTFQAANRGGVVLTGGVHHFVPYNWTGGPKQTGATHVTIRGLIFRDYAPTKNADGSDPGARYRAAVGAIRGWTIEDCLFDAAGYSGLDIRGDSVTVLRSTFRYHHTHALAAAGTDTDYVDNAVVRDVILHGNNTRPDELTGKASSKVVKFWKTTGALIDNIESYDNDGSGWWFDTNNSGYTIRDSYLHHQRGAGRGVFLEVSWGGRVEGNVFAHNEVVGLGIRNTSGVLVTRNLFYGDRRAIQLVSHDVEGTWPLEDVSILGNYFAGWLSPSAIHSGGNQIGLRTAAQRRIVADGNVYDPGPSAELAWWSYTGWIRSIDDMRTKLGWETNGRIGPISIPGGLS